MRRGVQRVLGIDPGTRIAGYGLVEVHGPGHVRYVECGLLEPDGPPGTIEIGLRIHQIARGLLEVIDELEPDHVALECAYSGPNVSSALKLAEARGALREVCIQRGLVPSEYQPSRVKKAVAGRAKATKAEVQERVRLLCGLGRVPPTDAADALALALCHVGAIVGEAVIASGAAQGGRP